MPSRSALGLPDIRGRSPLLAALGIDSFGSGCAAPLLLLFFNRVAGIPLGRAGLTISLATVFSIVIPALVGHIIDRAGPKNLIIAAQLMQCLAFIGLLFFRELGLLFVCALLSAAGQRVFWSSIFTLLSRVAGGRDRDRWFGLAGMIQAAGFGLGSLAAGILLDFHGSTPYLIAMGINAGSFLTAAWALTRLQVGDQRPPAAAEDDVKVRIRHDRPFLALIAMNTVLALCSMVFGVGLPVFVADALPVPKWIIGVLLALVSMVLASGQTLVVRMSENRNRVMVLVGAASLWATWGVLMSLLVHVPKWVVIPGLLVATLVFAGADLLHAATHNALAAAVAPAAAHGKYLSYWQYSFTFAGVIAPAFFATLFSARPEFPWLGVSVLAVAVAVALPILTRPGQTR